MEAFTKTQYKVFPVSLGLLKLMSGFELAPSGKALFIYGCHAGHACDNIHIPWWSSDNSFLIRKLLNNFAQC